MANYEPVYSKEIQESLSKEFKHILKGKTYLDHAGATLYSHQQISNVHDDLTSNLFANPHSKSTTSKATEDLVDAVRYQILDFFGTTTDEYSVIFTGGATSALKLVGETFNYGNTGQLVYLAENHTSVLGMRAYAKRHKALNKEECFEIFNNINVNVKVNGHKQQNGDSHKLGNSLFVYPAQCNFSGYKYPLEWIDKVHGGVMGGQNCYCLLDAASYVGTNALNLSDNPADFVTISFYKIFGYPTGLGALLVRNQNGHLLKKKYFGGGTVYMALANRDEVIHRENLSEKFEDGTIAFLSIAALKHGFAILKRHKIDMNIVSRHVYNLAKYVYDSLKELKHYNGRACCVLYQDGDFTAIGHQGGICNFNILRADGAFVGYAEVMHMANLHDISLRTGCFCNPGACQRHLGITSDEVKYYYEMGHVCGDQRDLINQKPTGSVRISFGYMSTQQDADTFLRMIRNCFVELSPSPVHKQLPKIEENGNTGQTLGMLENIYIYPVKSCAAFAITTTWPLIDTGLAYDRQFMIVNRNGTCLTQKHDTKLCTIKPLIDMNQQKMTLTADNFADIEVDLKFVNTILGISGDCKGKICGDKVQGSDCGNEVATWLEDVLCTQGLRLWRQADRSAKHDVHLSLVNQAQFLLVNKASVRWLNDRVPEDARSDLDDSIARFRPNFVINFGTDAFIENDFKTLFIGGHQFLVQGPCTRCQMICIDQKNGEKTVEPLRTLSREMQGKIFFGIYCRLLIARGEIAPATKIIALNTNKHTTE